jgi:hypothetical protein
VTLRIALIGAVTLAALVLVFGPSAYVLVTGRPISVECVGPEPEVCDEAVRGAASGGGPGFGPVTWIKIQLVGGSCGTYTVGHWWPFYDPFAITAQPLC